MLSGKRAYLSELCLFVHVGKQRSIEEWGGSGAGSPGRWDSQPGSISQLPPAHVPLRRQAHASARHSVVPTKSQAGWLPGSTCLVARPPAPDPLLTNQSVELSKSMTHFPQCSSPDTLPYGPSLCPGEFLQPAGTSTTCSGQLHPAQTSPGCCPRPLPLPSPLLPSLLALSALSQKCVSLTWAFLTAVLPDPISPPLICKSVHIRFLLWLLLSSRIKPKPIGCVSHPKAESISLEFPLPSESREDGFV